jgi:hypothetical protein
VPSLFFLKIRAGFNAWVVSKAIDIQIGEENVKPVMVFELSQHLFQTNAIKWVVFVVDLVIHRSVCSMLLSLLYVASSDVLYVTAKTSFSRVLTVFKIGIQR